MIVSKNISQQTIFYQESLIRSFTKRLCSCVRSHQGILSTCLSPQQYGKGVTYTSNVFKPCRWLFLYIFTGLEYKLPRSKCNTFHIRDVTRSTVR